MSDETTVEQAAQLLKKIMEVGQLLAKAAYAPTVKIGKERPEPKKDNASDVASVPNHNVSH